MSMYLKALYLICLLAPPPPSQFLQIIEDTNSPIGNIDLHDLYLINLIG